ncbi:MAG: ATP-binding protein [Thermodesulfovibrionales bacterium]
MSHLTESTFEEFLPEFNNSETIDLTNITFIDPYGMLGIIEIGEVTSKAGNLKTLLLPSDNEAIKYLERMDFLRYASQNYMIKPEVLKLSERYRRRVHSDVLLEITKIERSDDIHFIVAKVKARADVILKRHLHYNQRAINGFIVALAEVCQNIVEHSNSKGYVGIQKYHFQNLNKNVVKIAVSDTGIGFQKSLSQRFNIRDDLEAIEKALIHGASRYSDKGRGHGLAAVRRFVTEWNGKLSIRSGTARLSIIPEWSKGKSHEKNLTFFPGAQISIMLPEVRP